jgi:uncharacterized protein (TIGR02600 family)
MKSKRFPMSSRLLYSHHAVRGMALLIVMTMLVLISIIVVGILVSARQQASSTKSYSAGSEAKMLADVAVNLVTAQIVEATKDTEDPETDEPMTWISQPGLIRTYTPGKQKKAYKLFSSNEMIADGTYDPGAAATLEAETTSDGQPWYARPEEFVDLNEPVEIHTKTGVRRVFPIVDPFVGEGDEGDGLVQGFSYNAEDVVNPDGQGPSNPLPMPVRWLYVTKDGKLVPATDPLKAEAKARIAFWTDDDTSKVNINTAAGGVFFDTPFANVKEEHQLGRTQPIAQEYQRWPGHPSTTSLSPVIKQLRDITDLRERSKLASLLTPRIGWGGSEGGEKYAWIHRNLGTTDLDRLYASVDEYSFGQGLAGGQRTENEVGGVSLADEDSGIDRVGFFLTAHSRAPEVNLFGRPRISLWPFNEEMVNDTVENATPAQEGVVAPLTPEDKLIRFNSELGGTDGRGNLDYTQRKRFYFQRKSAWDPEADWSIKENRAVFRYLQELTKLTPPSSNVARGGNNGQTLETKYGTANRDQILTEMWDYIRSNINTLNQAYQPVGFLHYSFPQGHTSDNSGWNDVGPLFTQDGQNRSIGRTAVLSDIIFQFYNVGEEVENVDQFRNNDPSVAVPDGVADYVIRKVRMVVLLNFHMPTAHLYGSVPRFQVRIRSKDHPFNFITSDALAGDHGYAGVVLNPSVPAETPIKVRNQTGNKDWDFTLYDYVNTPGDGNPGIGFPAVNTAVVPPPGQEDPEGTTFRETNFIASQAVMTGEEFTTGGGNLAVQYPMMALKKNNALQSIKATNNFWPDHSGLHVMKVLSNRKESSSLQSEDNQQRGLFESPSMREDIYYPFVSDIIEFRLPQAHIPEGSLPPTVAETPPMARNGNNQDFFEVLFTGAQLEITIYPGLKDGATTFNTTSWQNQLSDNYIWRTRLNVSSAIIPLPRLASDVPLGTENWRTPHMSGTPYSYKDLANYYIRGRFTEPDKVMLVPQKHEGGSEDGESTHQMDVFRGYSLTGGDPLYGDLRLAGARRDIPESWWESHPLYHTRGVFHGTSYIPKFMKKATGVAIGEQYKLRVRDDDPYYSWTSNPDDNNFTDPANVLRTAARLHSDLNGTSPYTVRRYKWNINFRRSAAHSTDGTIRSGSRFGDWTMGYGNTSIGSLILGPDTGAVSLSTNINDFSTWNSGANSPYFAIGIGREGDSDVSTNNQNYHVNMTGYLHSPFKQVPSPVLFGTIPSRPLSKGTGSTGDPGSWETLLFSPNPAGGASTHRGWNQAPRDHYWLDMFYMPVVEPYAITDNFSTAGKINLNYQIAPFNYISRKTGLYALLDGMAKSGTLDDKLPRGTSIVALPKTVAEGANSPYGTNVFRAQDFKMSAAPTLSEADSFRRYVNINETLKQFDARFQQNDPFVSATEITEMFLVPEGRTAADTPAFWDTMIMTGDDKREMPYNHLYPRVTTRSNTFTVHYRVQTISPRPLGQDSIVTGEYRGSTTIERYLDPNLQQYGVPIDDGVDPLDYFPPLSGHYKIRKVEQKHFSP